MGFSLLLCFLLLASARRVCLAMSGMTLANKITIGRILLIPVFVALLLYYRPDRDLLRVIALWLFGAAVISDGVDGFLARHRGQRTPLGALLDPLADKLLMTSAFLTLALSATWPAEARVPPWVTVSVISRDMLLILGSLVIYLMTGRLAIQPNWLGKWTTATQMASLLAALFLWPRPVLRIFWGVAVALTGLSTIGYLRLGARWLNPTPMNASEEAERQEAEKQR